MRTKLFILLFAMLASTACNKDETPTEPTPTPDARVAVVQFYGQLVHAGYEDSYIAAQTLKTEIDNFVASPTAAGLEACKQAWLQSRIPYGQTEGFRFYDGPIDSEEGPEGRLNAWPLNEAFIDYVIGDANAGIINDVVNFPNLDAQTLVTQNENGAEDNISIGYHAIEFLLWGQDTSATGPGARPYTDYTTAPQAARRGEYLKKCAALLVSDLEGLVAEWAPGNPDNYRAAMERIDPQIALTRILTGIGSLSKSELKNERLLTALTLNSQEDEHSCFADNTHEDAYRNAQSIRNVYEGTYTRTSGSVLTGAGISTLVQAANPTLNQTLLQALATTQSTADVLVANRPFDQLILASNPSGNQIVQNLINALEAQSIKIDSVAIVLGLN